MARFLRFATLAAFLLVLLPSVALAQDDAASPALTPRGPEYSKQEMEDYQQAIQNCDTPSLECLVYYTSRYMAIEWLQEIVGDSGGPTGTGNDSLAPPLSPNTINAAPGENRIAQRTGAISGLNYMMGQMYANPAASTEEFVADVMNSSGFAQPAYAQGLGFASLNPVLSLWKVFRNIAYTFFVVVFVVIGFMIMFRTKISGNAAVTAQQAIPSIIISLLLVTFSYAIAGLLIDFMYLVMFLILGLFAVSLPQINSQSIIDYNILQLTGELFRATTFKDGALQDNMNLIETFLNGIHDLGPLNDVASWLGGVLFSLIIAVAVLIATIKLFFELLKSYATIVISVVTAPLFLMMGAIPGKNVFTPWLRNMVGNLMAFPMVLLIIVIYYQFVGGLEAVNLDEGGFMPPFLLGRGVPGGIASLVGLALLLALPEIVQKTKEALGAKGGIGEMIASAAWKTGKEAAPLPMRVAGAGAGVLPGAMIGAARGFRDNWAAFKNGQFGAGLSGVLSTAGRYAGNYADAGSRAGGWVSGQIGAKHPGYLQPFESGFTKIAKSATEKARLERMERATYEERTLPQRILNPGGMSYVEWQAATQLAKLEKDRKDQYNKELSSSMRSAQSGGTVDYAKLRDIAQAKLKHDK